MQEVEKNCSTHLHVSRSCASWRRHRLIVALEIAIAFLIVSPLLHAKQRCEKQQNPDETTRIEDVLASTTRNEDNLLHAESAALDALLLEELVVTAKL